MSRTSRVAALAIAVLALVAPAAHAHKGDPNYRSELGAMRPEQAGVTVRVLDRDDRLELVNRSRATIVIEGYEGEPYARLKPDGTVEVNRRSPAHYLNEDRFAQVSVPAEADEKAAPSWQVIDRTGRFEWHDHRIHWMTKTRPPQVTDEGRRTKVLDWRVPLSVDGEPAALTGTLYWVPTASGFPVGAAVALGAVALLGLGAVVLVRRRRRAAATLRREAEAW